MERDGLALSMQGFEHALDIIVRVSETKKYILEDEKELILITMYYRTMKQIRLAEQMNRKQLSAIDTSLVVAKRILVTNGSDTDKIDFEVFKRLGESNGV